MPLFPTALNHAHIYRMHIISWSTFLTTSNSWQGHISHVNFLSLGDTKAIFKVKLKETFPLTWKTIVLSQSVIVPNGLGPKEEGWQWYQGEGWEPLFPRRYLQCWWRQPEYESSAVNWQLSEVEKLFPTVSIRHKYWLYLILNYRNKWIKWCKWQL